MVGKEKIEERKYRLGLIKTTKNPSNRMRQALAYNLQEMGTGATYSFTVAVFLSSMTVRIVAQAGGTL